MKSKPDYLLVFFLILSCVSFLWGTEEKKYKRKITLLQFIRVICKKKIKMILEYKQQVPQPFALNIFTTWFRFTWNYWSFTLSSFYFYLFFMLWCADWIEDAGWDYRGQQNNRLEYIITCSVNLVILFVGNLNSLIWYILFLFWAPFYKKWHLPSAKKISKIFFQNS